MNQKNDVEKFYISKKDSEEYKKLEDKADKIANYLSNGSLGEEQRNRLKEKIRFHLVSEKNIKENIISSFFLWGIALSACVLIIWTSLDPTPFYENILNAYLETKYNYLDTAKTANEVKIPSEIGIVIWGWFGCILLILCRLIYKHRSPIRHKLLDKRGYWKVIDQEIEKAIDRRHQIYPEKNEQIKNEYIISNLIEDKLSILLSRLWPFNPYFLVFFLAIGYILNLYVNFVSTAEFDWNLSFQHVTVIVFLIRIFIVLILVSYTSFLISKEYIYRYFPLSQIFSKFYESIVILKNAYLGIDRSEKDKLIRNLEEIAVLFEKYPDSVLGVTEYEYCLAKNESRKIAHQFRKFKFWVVYPRTDTYTYLKKTLISDLTALLTDDFHNVSRASEEEVLRDIKPLKIKTLVVLRHYLGILLKAGIPLFLLLTFQQTPFHLQGDILDYVTVGSFAFAALVLLLELDPKYLDYLKNFSELVKELKSGK